MVRLRIDEANVSCESAFEFTIDATEGRLKFSQYAFAAEFAGATIKVKVSTIGMGIEPAAMICDNAVVVQANSSLWVLTCLDEGFNEISLGYPLIETQQVEGGFIVFHHLGCEFVSSVWVLRWKHLGGTLEDFSIKDDKVTMIFDMGRVVLDLATGDEIEVDHSI